MLHLRMLHVVVISIRPQRRGKKNSMCFIPHSMN